MRELSLDPHCTANYTVFYIKLGKVPWIIVPCWFALSTELFNKSSIYIKFLMNQNFPVLQYLCRPPGGSGPLPYNLICLNILKYEMSHQ